MEISIKKTRNDIPLTITIFTDLQVAITKILDPKVKIRRNAIQTLIYKNAYKIKSSSHGLILRWLPSYSKISENEKSDMSVKNLAQRKERLTNHMSSLTVIKTKLYKMK